MDIDNYQTEALKSAIYPERGTNSILAKVYCALGLSEESGEVAGKLKKIIRDAEGIITEENRERIKRELGDVLWYAAALARELELKLSEIAESNLEKIRERLGRGTLRGSGDDR